MNPIGPQSYARIRFGEGQMAQDLVDRVDRRGFLECMGWAGTGALFTLSGGIASSTMIERAMAAPRTSVPAVTP
ncbi:hypothetical protein ACKI1O_51485, partial [Streptomyces scabiei]